MAIRYFILDQIQRVYLILLRAAVKQMGLPLEVAVGCATINPARSLDIDDQYGSIEAGKKAHVVLLDKELNLTAVIKDGVRIC